MPRDIYSWDPSLLFAEDPVTDLTPPRRLAKPVVPEIDIGGMIGRSVGRMEPSMAFPAPTSAVPVPAEAPKFLPSGVKAGAAKYPAGGIAAPREVGVLERLGRAAKAPLEHAAKLGMTGLLGDLAKAFTAKDPTSWQYQLGSMVSAKATADVYAKYAKNLEEMISGRAPTGEPTAGMTALEKQRLTPEMRARGVETVGRARQIGVTEDYQAALAGYYGALTERVGKELTPEEKQTFQLELVKAQQQGNRPFSVTVGGQDLFHEWNAEAGRYEVTREEPHRFAPTMAPLGYELSVKRRQDALYKNALSAAWKEAGFGPASGELFQDAFGNITIRWASAAMEKEGIAKLRGILGPKLDVMIGAGQMEPWYKDMPIGGGAGDVEDFVPGKKYDAGEKVRLPDGRIITVVED